MTLVEQAHTARIAADDVRPAFGAARLRLGLVLTLTDWGKDVAPYLPSRATSAMLESTSGGFDNQAVHELSWWAGALVLTAYAALMAGLGTWRTLRSDIS